MHISTEELQSLLNTFGTVMAARKRELDITSQEDFAESDLVTAQEVTTDAINDLKMAIASKITTEDLTILQEGESLPWGVDGVIMPAVIGCSC